VIARQRKRRFLILDLPVASLDLFRLQLVVATIRLIFDTLFPLLFFSLTGGETYSPHEASLRGSQAAVFLLVPP